MPRPRTPRDTAEYRKAAAALKAEGHGCWICRRPIDPARRWPDPLSFSADHVVELASGGTNDPENLRASHLGCNSRRGAYYQQGRRFIEPRERDW